ncbi:hypothetical protein A2U01_0062752, partial [Trifolium medium]|nr:hypothetical protein [Trifolium medium]
LRRLAWAVILERGRENSRRSEAGGNCGGVRLVLVKRGAI